MFAPDHSQTNLRWLLALSVTLLTVPAFGQSQRTNELRTIEKRILANVEHMRAVTVAVQVGSNNASGVVVEGGFALTTGHVVEDIGQLATVQFVDGATREATVHAVDRGNDVALLKLADAKDLPFATLSNKGLAAMAPQPVIAVGNPGGFRANRAALVRLGMAVGGDLARSSCQISRGDSGGPLFDLDGRIVGIHRQIRKGTKDNFHTHARVIAANWKLLIAGGTIAGPQPLIEKTVWKLPEPPLAAFVQTCVEVHCGGKQVALGTVVDKQRGLIITKASELFGKNLQIRRAGETIAATLLHTDRAHDLAALEAKHDWPEQIDLTNAGTSQIGRIVLSVLPGGKCKQSIIGAAQRGIDRQPGELGLAVEPTVTVTEVRPNSAASKGGVQKSDRILELDGTKVAAPSEIGAVLKQRNAGDRFKLTVRRDEESQVLSIQLLHPASKRFDNETFQLGAGGESSLRRSGFPAILQHDATIEPRNCGGPVVNLAGQFVGINVARAGREAVYMIPAAELRGLLDRIREVL